MNTPRFEFESPPMDITGGPEDLLDVGLARRLCEHSPLGIFLADSEGRCVYSNAACQRILGLAFGQVLGRPWSDFVLPEDRQRALTEWRTAMREGRPLQADVRVQRADASRGWTRLHGSTINGGSKPSAYLLMIEDITGQKAAEGVLRDAEESLFVEKERAQVTLDSIGDAVLATDLLGNVTYMNLEAESLTGWASEEALGQPLAEVFHIVDGETLEVASNPARRAIEEDRTVGPELGCLLLRRDRSGVAIEDSAAPIHDRDGSVAGAVIVFHDAAQSRALARQNAHLAWHDQLTGLPNTALFTERLTQATRMAYRNCTRVALLFIDLDRFKPVNDTHGHLVGDELLKSVAARLENCVRATDTVCRRSGDEFVVLLSEIGRRQDAGHLAEKIFSALSVPHVLSGITVEIAVSIGISVYPDDGEDAHTLMERADAAMYKAKAADLHTYCFAGADHDTRPVAAGWRVGGLSWGFPRLQIGDRQTTEIPSFLKLEK